MKHIHKKQKGFSILAVILVMAVIIVAISAWALSGQANISQQSGTTNDALAAALVSDGETIKQEYDRLLLQYNDSQKIVFVPNTLSTATSYNILDPSTGIQQPKVSPKLLKPGYNTYEGIWVYNDAQFLGFVGDPNNADPTVLVSGLTDEVCKSINYIVSGNRVLLGAGMYAYKPTDASYSSPHSDVFVNLSYINFYQGVYSGCIGTSSGINFYFRILKAN